MAIRTILAAAIELLLSFTGALLISFSLPFSAWWDALLLILGIMLIKINFRIGKKTR